MEFLTNCESKYWELVYNKKYSFVYSKYKVDLKYGEDPIGVYKITSDGRCYFLKFNDSKTKYWLWADGDYRQSTTWNFVFLSQHFSYEQS